MASGGTSGRVGWRHEFLIEFDGLAEHLERLGTAASPSELHGVVAGMLCGAGRIEESALLEVLDLPSGTDLVSAAPWLEDLLRQTRERLSDPLFRFAPLLPPDDRPLDARSEALGEWCSGFLCGVALVGVSELSTLASDAQEYLRDVSEIARASRDSVTEGADEDEAAFAELVEYLRTGAMLMAENLAGQDPAPAPDV
jgi:uncharacterized protein YgfB (UPF0149 family)